MKTNHPYSPPACQIFELWLEQSINITSPLGSDAEDIGFLYDDGSDD